MPDIKANHLRPYGVAIIAVILAVLLRLLIDPLVNERMPVATLFLAASVMAWYAGSGPAWFTLILGILPVTYFIIEPRQSFVIEHPEDIYSFVFYVALSMGLIRLFEKLATARKQAESSAAEARAEYLQLHRESELRKSTESALRQSEEKLQLLADTIPQLAWMARPDGYILWFNRRAYEYTGATHAQLEGWGWDFLLHPESKAAVLEGWRASIASGEPFELIFPMRGGDGKFRAFLTRINPLRDAAGRILYWFGTNTDIEDQQRANAALVESGQRFRQLADAMPQIVWTAGPDGNIDYQNRQWQEFTGLSETIGNQGWGQILHPDDASLARERWAESRLTGVSFDMELRLLDRRTQAYRWHLIRTVAVKDAQGNITRWFGTGTDIQEQKRAEESSRFLAEASAALAAVVDYENTLEKVANLAVPYFADWSAVDIANADGTLRRLAVAHRDPAKLALVRELQDEYPPDPESPHGTYAVLRTGKPQIFSDIPDELLVRAAADARHLALLRSLNLKSYICVPLIVSGKAVGIFIFATAESGRRYDNAELLLAMDLASRASIAIANAELYQALRESDRRKDEFLATLAHELRNPLATISNSLHVLRMSQVDATTLQRSHDMMQRHLALLVRLVDDLLDVSRVTAGKIGLHLERVELASIVVRAQDMVQAFVDAQGHELVVQVPATALAVEADPLRLSQVIANILANAAKYSHPNGRIVVSAQREGDTALLRIRDDGIGIDAPMLSRIFQMFVQVDHTSTKAHGGLGIGLTLARNLVELHNGTIEARSEGLGKGSEFIVRLPLAQGVVMAEVAPMPVQASAPPAARLRLFVVDDNQDAATSLMMLLRLQGHEVKVANSGKAALEIAPAYVPDAVFLDIGMPGMDGFEVARRIRQTPGLENVVLVAVSGWGQQEDRRRSADAGFNAHLVKPAELAALQAVLAGL